MSEEPTEWRLSLSDVVTGSVIRRARGVWLAHWYQHRDGIEDYDAFPTEKQARKFVERGLSDASESVRNRRWIERVSGHLIFLVDEWDQFYVDDNEEETHG